MRGPRPPRRAVGRRSWPSGSGWPPGVPAVVLTHQRHGGRRAAPGGGRGRTTAGVPLLVCTADRPPELQRRRRAADHRPDPPVRPGGPLVRRARAWPTRPAAGRWRVAGRPGAWPRPPAPARARCTSNLAFREPLVGDARRRCRRAAPTDGRRGTWRPSGRRAARRRSVDLAGDLAGRRGVIVAGAGVGRRRRASHALADGARAGRCWPTRGRAAGRRRPRRSPRFDALLRHRDSPTARGPRSSLRLGRAAGVEGARTSGWPTPAPPQVRRRTRTARGSTPTARLDRVVVGPTPALASGGPLDRRRHAGRRRRWLGGVAGGRGRRAAGHRRRARPSTPSRPSPASPGRCWPRCPTAAALVVSSSMPVRDLEWYAAPRAGRRGARQPGRQRHRRRGVDRGRRRARHAARRPSLLVGDVAFLHDTQRAARPRPTRGVDLTIVVVDNDGGGIFSFLPQARPLPTERVRAALRHAARRRPRRRWPRPTASPCQPVGRADEVGAGGRRRRWPRGGVRVVRRPHRPGRQRRRPRRAPRRRGRRRSTQLWR